MLIDKLLITIDGPAGAGKTTVSKILADRLGYKYIDTGALYRGVAFEAMSAGINSDDDKSLEILCGKMNLSFKINGRELSLISNNFDITAKIRSPEVTMMASAVSSRQVVRKYLFDLQRDLGKEKAVVFEGRDMGTVVFPEADVKFFIEASLETRALRRFDEMQSKENLTFEDIKADIKLRDQNDSTRVLAPLKPAGDAIIIDSTDFRIDEVVEILLSHIERL